jgi:hypothetical protein
VVGVAGPVAPEDLRVRAKKVIEELGSSMGSLRFAFALPGSPDAAAFSNADQNGSTPLTLVPFSASASSSEFWSDVSANQRAVLALTASLKARACIVLGADLAALNAHTIQLFSYAILERQCGLAVPVYPSGKYEGLLNSGILAPLHRALYGRRVRFPLTYEFAASGAMAARLARHHDARDSGSLLWPVAIAATQSPQSPMGEVVLDVHHQSAQAGLDLSVVLGQLAGSLFYEMERDAPQWQRIRGSQPVPSWGNAPEDSGEIEPGDPQPTLDSFLLGSKNLDEVWRLLLPPNSMLELRRLTRMRPEQFHMPDQLWASIVYDFALAWRLRTISRVHLLGALTPLYLGWVSSYIREVSSLTRAAAEQRLEELFRAWEEKKPYLVSRWRWPDRFNP